MKKIAITILILAASLSSQAGTYFISAVGNDANDGLTKATAWAHSPGMPACASACLAKANGTSFNGVNYPAIAGGDSFVFRGRDVWHMGDSGATPYTGGTWSIAFNGSSLSQRAFKRPTSAGATGSGSAWSNPAQALTFSTTSFNSTTTSATSQNLDITGFGFAVPANATITEIDIGINGNLSSSNGVSRYSLQLMQASSPVGNAFSPDTGGSVYYGNIMSNWGGTWTPTAVNDPGFGVRIIANGNGTSDTFNMNGVNVIVRYTVPGTGDCDITDDPNADRSTCVSVGASDHSWFSGGSWARAVLDGDNPLSTTAVVSCAHYPIGSGNNFITFSNNWYVWMRSFELRGLCDATPVGVSNSSKNNYVVQFGSSTALQRNIITDFYVHGSTHIPYNCGGGTGVCLSNQAFGAGLVSMSTLEKSIVDCGDSDPTDCPARVFDWAYLAYQNVFKDYSQSIENTEHSVHDNLFLSYGPTGDANPPTFAGSHGNEFKAQREAPFCNTNGNDCTPYVPYNVFYNNVENHAKSATDGDVKYWSCGSANVKQFDFNNLLVDQRAANYWNSPVTNQGCSSRIAGWNTFNNFFDVPSLSVQAPYFILGANLAWIGNFIVSDGTAFTGSGGTNTNNVVINHATAVSQGYMSNGIGTAQGNPNNATCNNDTAPCAPLHNTDASVGTGADVTALCTELQNSWDKMIKAAGDACLKTGTGAVAYAGNGQTVVWPAVPTGLKGSVTPDAGPFKFSGASPTFALSVVSTNGSVTSADAHINCGATCSYGLYASGATVVLTATPSAGNSFAGWSVTPPTAGTCPNTSLTCTVTMNPDVNVTATSQATTFTLQVASTNGVVTSVPSGVSCPSSCSVDFNVGTPVTLTELPNVGYGFVGWTGGCSGTGACVVTMSQARNVTAVFALIGTSINIRGRVVLGNGVKIH